MGRASVATSIAMMCGLTALLAADRTALGQGSAGGTLGKTDKSAGGARDTEQPAKPAVHQKKDAAPAAAVSVAGSWKWTADCQSGHYVGGFQLTQDAAGEFNGVFLQTIWYDIGTITNGRVSNGTISFIRHVGVTQNWTGRFGDGGKHINGNITGNENCTWEGVKE
jgi:hypothetical protein